MKNEQWTGICYEWRYAIAVRLDGRNSSVRAGAMYTEALYIFFGTINLREPCDRTVHASKIQERTVNSCIAATFMCRAAAASNLL